MLAYVTEVHQWKDENVILFFQNFCLMPTSLEDPLSKHITIEFCTNIMYLLFKLLNVAFDIFI